MKKTFSKVFVHSKYKLASQDDASAPSLSTLQGKAFEKNK